MRTRKTEGGERGRLAGFWFLVSGFWFLVSFHSSPFTLQNHYLHETHSIDKTGPRLRPYVNLARPFTLLPPLLGIISGAVCAWGSAHNPDPTRAVTWSVVLTIVLGSVCASFLNAANNALNQIYDLEIDRINKPKRPLVFGVRKAAYIIAPFFVFPWLLMPLGAHLHILTGNPLALEIVGFTLSVWGVYTLWLIVRNPDELTSTENHPSWRHMYLMMMAAQIGFAVAYVI